MLLRIIGALLAIWLAFIVIGFVIKAAVFLAIIGGVLFLGTAAYAAIKNNQRRQIR